MLSRRVQVNRFAIVIQTPSSGQQNPAGTPAHWPVPMHPLEEALDKWCKRATLLRCVALACTEYRTRGKLRYFRAPAFFLCQGSPFTTELAIVCTLQTASLKTKSILLPEKCFLTFRNDYTEEPHGYWRNTNRLELFRKNTTLPSWRCNAGYAKHILFSQQYAHSN